MRTESTAMPTCPRCGHKDRDAWELGLIGDGAETDVECGKCGTRMTVVMELTIRYRTRPVAAEKGEG